MTSTRIGRPFLRVVAPALVAVLAVGLSGLTPAYAARPLDLPRPAPAAGPADLPAPAAATDRVQQWDTDHPSMQAEARDLVADARPRATEKTLLRVVQVTERDGAPHFDVTPVRGESGAAEVIEEAQADDEVIAVAVEGWVRLDSQVTAAGTNDTHSSKQWGLTKLEADRVWQHATGAGSVVAVIDSGVDGTHPDLWGRLTSAGVDYVGGGNGQVDPNGHGTHVAGIIAATRNNGIGVAGFAPDAKIMPIRALDAEGRGSTVDIAKGITFATDAGADVINLSLGGPTADAATQKAVEYALSKGVAVVAAMGNARESGSPTNYPAAFPGVVAVSSTDSSDAISYFSSKGAHVDVAAPGSQIVSTYPGARYASMSGTSMATPFVAAVAAVAVEASRGAVTPAQFESTLARTANDRGASGFDDDFGHGLVDAYELMCGVSSVCGGAAPAPSPSPSPEPATETQPEPEPQPESEPEPAPRPAPAPAKGEVGVDFTAGGGRALVGARRTVRGIVRDAESGNPIAGHVVRLIGRSGGEVVVRRRATSDAQGRVSMRFKVIRTVRVVLRSPATTSTEAARSPRAIRWAAVPRVRADYRRPVAKVFVANDRGQRVRFQRRAGARWVTVATRSLNDVGRTRIRTGRPGLYRARITRVPGLVAALTGTWKIT